MTHHNGTEVLSDFLEHLLQEGDAAAYRRVMARMLSGLSFWLEPGVYQRRPILMPYAVRDAGARRKGRKSSKEEWGSPSAQGYSRDDNSWIKNLANSAKVVSTGGIVPRGDKIKGGFTACHLWRRDKADKTDAVTVPLLYSFVPNLAWLPTSLAVLTDHRGSFAQRYMQSLALTIYKPLQVETGMAALAKESWSQLKSPGKIEVKPDPKVNFLGLASTTLNTQAEKTQQAAAALRARSQGKKVTCKVVTTRYGPGLNELNPNAVKPAAEFLERYVAAIHRAQTK